MGHFLPLPPGLAKRMIAGVENELKPLNDERLAQIRNKPCPRCKNAMHPFLNAQHTFTPDDPLPRVHGRCTECGCEWDPRTNLILDTGDPRKVSETTPIVRPPRD